MLGMFFFFSSRRRHTRCYRDWSSDVCSSDLMRVATGAVIILALSLLSIAKLAAVTPVRAGALVLHKANYFDLQHRRIRFVPASGGSYTLSVSASSLRPQRGSLIAK